MNSFYGGQQGKSFTISEIFANKKELVNDLQKRWISDIMPGEYVIISYGSYGIYSNEDESKTQYELNYQTDYDIYGISYNGTLWEKIYYEPTEEDINNLIQNGYNYNNDSGGVGFYDISDENGITYLMSGVETIFYSKDYGLGYKLITSMTGATPHLSVSDETIILGPLENPDVEVNINDVNNPQFQFSLPRAVRFFFGDQLGFDTMPELDKEYVISNSEINSEIQLGDYYINKNTGYVFLLSKIDGINFTFTFKACFQPPAPQTEHIIGTSYYQDSETQQWTSNYPKIEFQKINNGWKAIVTSPHIPNIVIGEVNYMGSLETGNITGKPINENDYQLDFNIPGGPKYFTGDKIEGTDISQVIIDGAKPGDLYINTNYSSNYNGNIYQLQLDGNWKNTGSIKGATGDALKIKNSYQITPTQVANDTLEDVGKYLTQQGEKLENDELIVVNYIDSNGNDTAYWYYQLDNNWYRVRVTGGLYSLLKDEYTDSNEGYIYTTRYINGLIVGENNPNTNPERNTYNINTINKLINEATIQWDDFY